MSNAKVEVGWLMKKSKWLGAWRTRYFKLEGTKFSFAKDENTPPHGVIDVSTLKSIQMIQKEGFNVIEIVLASDTYYVQGEDDKDSLGWIKVLSAAGGLKAQTSKKPKSTRPPGTPDFDATSQSQISCDNLLRQAIKLEQAGDYDNAEDLFHDAFMGFKYLSGGEMNRDTYEALDRLVEAMRKNKKSEEGRTIMRKYNKRRDKVYDDFE